MVSIDEIGEELASILLKSRQGIYQDTSENRRKHRVGQHYGKESESEVKSDGSGITKKEERLARLEKYKDQLAQIEAMRKLEEKQLMQNFDYSRIHGLRLEAIEKLNKFQPVSIGQASRISGVSPADISLLAVWLQQQKGINNVT